jgi:hypothetical protein
MTAPLSAQRVEELKKSVLAGVPLDRKEMTDLLAILDSYSSMRAENERLRAEFSTLKKAYDDECAWRGRGYRDLLTRAEKAEAQLEKQRPLVEAVMGMSIKTLRLWRGLHGPDGEMESFLRAALKYREEEGK